MKWPEVVVARCAMGRDGSQEWRRYGIGSNSSGLGWSRVAGFLL